MKLIKISLIFLLLVLVGCKGPKGEKGDTGATGATGETGDTGTEGENAGAEIHTGNIPVDGSSIVSIGSGALASNTNVTVMIQLPSFVGVWYELGVYDSASAPYCAVNYNTSNVYFYQCLATWSYKIIVTTPATAPALSAKERFNYFNF